MTGPDGVDGHARACVNLIGIIRESERAMSRKRTWRRRRAAIEACQRVVKKQGSRGAAREDRGRDGRAPGPSMRFLQMSALGVNHEGISEYQRTK